jgi:hypothetical protein
MWRVKIKITNSEQRIAGCEARSLALPIAFLSAAVKAFTK